MLNDRLHSANVIGNVGKLRSNLCAVGKNSNHDAKLNGATNLIKGPVIIYWGSGHYIWGEGHYFLVQFRGGPLLF